jgi:hypothetical protein
MARPANLAGIVRHGPPERIAVDRVARGGMIGGPAGDLVVVKVAGKAAPDTKADPAAAGVPSKGLQKSNWRS